MQEIFQSETDAGELQIAIFLENIDGTPYSGATPTTGAGFTITLETPAGAVNNKTLTPGLQVGEYIMSATTAEVGTRGQGWTKVAKDGVILLWEEPFRVVRAYPDYATILSELTTLLANATTEIADLNDILNNRLPATLDGGNLRAKVEAYATGLDPLRGNNSQVLNVSAAHNAGIDWANVENPTTANNLANTTIGTVTSLAAGAITAIVNAILAMVIEGTLTFKHAMQAIFAEAASKASGFSTNSPKYRDAADSKDRISATTTADGRTAVVFNFD